MTVKPPTKDKTSINDPVYSQPASASSEDTAWIRAKVTLDGTVLYADDPVYTQDAPGPQISDVLRSRISSSSNPADQTRGPTQVNDPVYSQTTQAEDQKTAWIRAQIKGNKAIIYADDPVYTQELQRVHVTGQQEKTEINDPVYAQKQVAPSEKLAWIRTPVKGEGKVMYADDPVYTQSSRQDSSLGQDREIARDPSVNTATSRLSQLYSHVSSPSETKTQQPEQNARGRKSKSKSRKPSASSQELPADYSDILGHLAEMRRLSDTPDLNNRGYARQKTAGKLWARERIHKMLDPGTWRELGAASGTAIWRKDKDNPQAEHLESYVPTNNPQGFGQVTCPRTGQKRQIYLTADDFSIRGGHADGGNTLKTLQAEKIALKMKIPVVKLVDGSSGGGSVTTIKKQGYAYIPHNTILLPAVQQMNQGIPNLGAVVGPAIGLGAARVVSTHFSVMAGDIGSLFNAGPKVVEGATFEEDLSFTDLGGPAVHCTNGTIDNLAKDEAECFEQIKTVLGYLPDCGDLQAPPVMPCTDPTDREDLALRSIVPRKKSRMYNPWTIIESVVDRGSWFEIGKLWGRTAITGLARLGGKPVGILSLNCEVNSGALDVGGSQKMMKMIKFCDVFNLPIVQFVDVPGYAIGTVAERSATMKWGVMLAMAYYATTTPIFSIITRRVYGVAGGVMVDSREPIMRVAWPSAQVGSLPLDGGIEVGHRHELRQILAKDGQEGWKRRYKELEDEYIRLMNPARSANAFNIEDIIDPKDTRKIACRWTEDVYGKPMQERLNDRAARRICPTFS